MTARRKNVRTIAGYEPGALERAFTKHLLRKPRLGKGVFIARGEAFRPGPAPPRHRERPMRDVLMYLLWREGRFRPGDIAEHFEVTESAVSHARRRAEQHLQTDRKLQRQIKSLLAAG